MWGGGGGGEERMCVGVCELFGESRMLFLGVLCVSLADGNI